MPTVPDLASPWLPLPLPQLLERMRGADFFWCLAGGQAIAHVVGRPFRTHQDLDIVVRRTEQLAVRDWLDDWNLYAADPPGTLRPWTAGETLPATVHDIWCHREGGTSWELQIMLQETDSASWHYRRDARVHGAIKDLATFVAGVPCLRMDLQLLYKSKATRPKDELDFRELLPVLSIAERRNLARWLQLTHPDGHPWTAALAV